MRNVELVIEESMSKVSTVKLKLSFAALAILVLCLSLGGCLLVFSWRRHTSTRQHFNSGGCPYWRGDIRLKLCCLSWSRWRGSARLACQEDGGTLPPPPLNGDGHTWHHADGLLYEIVSQGGKMLEDPSYPGLQECHAGIW